MKRLRNAQVVLVLSIVLLIVLAAVARPARGRAAVAEDELSQKLYLPLVTKNANVLPPLFGVQTYGSTAPSNPYVPFLLESNASWVRVPIRWSAVEPNYSNPPSYDWSTVDSALAVAAQGSPWIIATIEYAPSWAADSPRAPIYPSQLPAFARFVEALVERYDGDGNQDAPGNPVVKYWEFYNEPDSSSDYWIPGWGNNGAAYAQMLQTVYPAVKRANSRAQVVFGGIAYDWWYAADGGPGPFVESFLDDVLQAGGGPFFDVMNFHSYPGFWRRWTDDGSSGLYEKAQAVRNKLLSYNLDKPLIITEAGWHSTNEPTAPSSPEQQARYVVELFVESMAADLDVMIWWMLFDPGDNYANGLVTTAPSPLPKPSLSAYKTIVSQLSEAKFVRTLATPPTVFNDDGTVHSMDAYEFHDAANRRTIYVAWMNPVNGTVTWPLRLAAHQGTMRNIYGTVTGTVVDADDGAVDGMITIPVSSQPVYVEVPW